MDPLTHTLVGFALSESGLKRRSRFAATALLVGANLPDIDALSYFAGGDFALGFRRGWTHGLLLAAVQPFALSAVLVWLDRLRPRGSLRASYWTLCRLSALAVATHPFLDWLNTYGVRFLMPFDGTWFYGDGLFVVDPYGWLMVGGSIFLARGPMNTPERIMWIVTAALTCLLVMSSGFVAIAAKGVYAAGILTLAAGRAFRSRETRPRIAAAGLTAMAAYIAIMLSASAAIESRARGGIERDAAAEAMASPAPANPFFWDVVIRTADGYRIGQWTWGREEPLNLSPRLIPFPPDDPLVTAAFEAPHVQGAVIWMRYPYVEIEPAEGGSVVWIRDARYDRLGRGGFGSAAVRLDRNLEPSPP